MRQRIRQIIVWKQLCRKFILKKVTLCCFHALHVIDEVGMIDVSDVKTDGVDSQETVSSGYLAEYLTDDE